MSKPLEEEAPQLQFEDDTSETALPPKLRKLYNKAEAATELRNWGYAVSLLQSVVAQEPGFLKGRKLLRLAAVKEAEGKKGLKLGGESLKVMKIQGQAKKDPLAAMIALEKDVLSTDPHNSQGNEALFEAAKNLDLPMTAGFALETAIQGNPNNTKYLHRLGNFYLEQEAFQKAADIFGQIAEKDPTDLDASKKFKDCTARASIKSQKWDSDGDWRDLLKDPSAAGDLEKEGRAAMTTDMLEEQKARLAQEYEADPNSIEVVKKLASTFEELEEFDSAVTYYEWAFQLSDNDPSLERKVSTMREKAGRSRVRELEQFIADYPDHPEVEECKVQLDQLKKEQMTNLIAESEDRVARNPTDTELRFELGDRLFQAERYRDAIQHLQQAKTSPNLRLRVMNMLGKCYDKMNMHDLAASQFEEAIKELTVMDDTKKDALYNLALLYEGMENKDKYLACLKEIYSVDYSYRDVAKRVESSY